MLQISICVHSWVMNSTSHFLALFLSSCLPVIPIQRQPTLILAHITQSNIPVFPSSYNHSYCTCLSTSLIGSTGLWKLKANSSRIFSKINEIRRIHLKNTTSKWERVLFLITTLHLKRMWWNKSDEPEVLSSDSSASRCGRMQGIWRKPRTKLESTATAWW